MSDAGQPMDWADRFRAVYDKAAAAFDRGDRRWQAWFDPEEEAFLASIGSRAHDVLDFVDDRRDLSFPTALLIVAVRRDYFREVQRGAASAHRVREADLPGRKEQLEGFEWLPRALAKARGRLRGELADELMFCCGGDRGFFRRQKIHPADFLHAVWAAGDDDAQVAAFVRGALP